MHNTINEFGFHKLSFQAIVFILACVRSVCEEDLDEALNEYTWFIPMYTYIYSYIYSLSISMHPRQLSRDRNLELII